MSHFHVRAVLGNGATVLFGVEAGDETGAAAVAYQRLSWIAQQAGAQQDASLEITPVCDGLIARLTARGRFAVPARGAR